MEAGVEYFFCSTTLSMSEAVSKVHVLSIFSLKAEALITVPAIGIFIPSRGGVVDSTTLLEDVYHLLMITFKVSTIFNSTSHFKPFEEFNFTTYSSHIIHQDIS